MQKALTSDVENAGIMMKLARVRNRAGAPEVAGDLYLRAFASLLKQQPVEADLPATPSRNPREANDGFSFQYKRHGTVLQNGLIHTLGVPAEPAFAAMEKAVDAALAEALQRAGGRFTRPFSNYPRLNAGARLARIAALASGHYEVADRIDANLVRHFAHDAAFVTPLVTQRLEFGLRDSAEALCDIEGLAPDLRTRLEAMTDARVSLDAISSLAATAREALEKRRFDLAVEAALAAGDTDLAYQAYVEWLTPASPTARNAPPAPAASSGGIMIMAATGVVIRRDGGSTGHAPLQHARTRLDAKRFVTLCRQAAITRPNLGKELLFSSDPSAEQPLIFTVEEAAGKPLLTEAELEAALFAMDQRQAMSVEMRYVVARLSAEAKLRFLTKFVETPPANQSMESMFQLMESVFRQPVAAEGLARIENAFKTQLAGYAKDMPYRVAMFAGAWTSQVPKMKEIAPGNAAWLQSFTQFLETTYPAQNMPGMMFGRGGPGNLTADDAVKQLLGQTGARPHPALSFAPPAILRYFLTQQAAAIYPALKRPMLEELEKRFKAEPKDEVFHAIVGVHEYDPARDRAPLQAWLDAVLQADPANKLALETQARLARSDGDPAAELRALEQLGKLVPEAEAVRTRIAQLWTVLDHPEKALATGAKQESASPTRDPYGRVPPQARRLVERLTSETSADAVRSAWSGLLQMLPPSWTPQNFFFYPGMGGPPMMAHSAFLEMDANRAASRSAGSHPALAVATSMIAQGKKGGDDAGSTKLIDLLARQPAALPELEAYVRTLDPSAIERDEQFRYYGALAEAYVAAGRARAEFDRLVARVKSGDAGAKESALWLEIAVRLPRGSVPGLPAIAEQALMRRTSFNNYDRLQLARLHAWAGESDKALEIYRVLLANVSVGSESNVRMAVSGRSGLLSFTGVIGDAVQWLDRATFQQFVRLAVSFATPSAGEDMQYWYARMRLLLAEKAVEAGLPAEALRELYSGFRVDQAGRADRVRYARIVARAAPEEALAALRLALAPGIAAEPDPAKLRDPAVRSYASRIGALSLDAGFGFGPVVEVATLTLFRDVFPATNDDWNGATAWASRAARAIPAWIASGEIDRELGLQVLALAIVRLDESSADEAKAAAVELVRLAERFAPVTQSTATLMASACERTGVAPAQEFALQMVRDMKVEPSVLAGLVRVVAAANGTAAAFEVGDAALTFTQNDALLQTLVTLARDADDDARATHYAMIRQRAATARALLEVSTSSSTASR